MSQYSMMHSYPFVNDGPTSTTPIQTTTTRKVPPGVIHIKPVWKPVKLDEKPPFSYATLIAHAILSSEHRKLTLSEIYQWISEKYPCYSMKDHRWQNSIRHNLSLQKAFVKLERNSTSPSGKGCYWTILSGYEQQFIDNLMKCELGGGQQQQQQEQSSNITHKQFKKFIDTNNLEKKKSSHLFTIFRMNPIQNKRKKLNNKEKKKRKTATTTTIQPKQQTIEYDSDCDSGIGFDCINDLPAKPVVIEEQQLTLDYSSYLTMDPLNLLNTDFFWPLYDFNLVENDAFLLQQNPYMYTTPSLSHFI